MKDYVKIIPCLDMKDQRVVKGINFVNIKDAGDPLEAAVKYNEAGADELVLLDISATIEKRKTLLDVVRKVAGAIDIPFTVGGGISSLEDMEKVLAAGATKVSVNSAAVLNPDLVKEAVERFGKEKIVVAVDAAKNDETGKYEVYISGGNTNTGRDVVEWIKELDGYNVGEILLTSKDADGTKAGYDVELTALASQNTSAAVTASGGAGSLEDFYDVIVNGGAKAVLAASLFHFGEVKINELKSYLKGKGVNIR